MTDIDKTKSSNRQLWQYAGIGGQLLVSLGIGVFIGLKADKWIGFSIPLLVWILPLLILIGMIYRLIKDTSKNK